MNRSPTASEPHERLRSLARALQALHRALLEYQRRDYERSFGRIGSDFYVLKLAADDPQFAWLRALSAEMMRIDVVLSDGGGDDLDLRLAGARLRYLLTPTGGGTPFQSRYDAAMQTNPDIVMAHAAVMRALPPARRVMLFRSQPPSDIRRDDAVPGVETRVHRPGELVPGHGDHGYRGLAAVAEVVMEAGAGTPMQARANEEVLFWVPEGTAEYADASGTTHPLDADHLVVVNAGSGVHERVHVLASGGQTRVTQFFVRPAAVQLEPLVQSRQVRAPAAGEWRSLVGLDEGDAPFTVRNRLAISDLFLHAGDDAPLPRRDGWDTYVFVYDGEVTIDGVPFGASDSGLLIAPESLTVSARADARLAAVVIDPTAKVTRAGTLAR